MKSKILKIIEEKHETSGGKCGTYTNKLTKMLGCGYKDIAGTLKELQKEGKIIIKEGIHPSQLIFKNKKIEK